MNELLKFIESYTGVADLLAAVTFTIAALFAWRDLNWRVKNLEDWKGRIDRLSERQSDILSSTVNNSTVLKEIAQGIDRRLTMLEDRDGREGK